MANPFVAEIRIFPFNFAPVGWAMCDGQILPISQNTALFSLLGTTYGGNGTSNFALPNLQGYAPMFNGQGPGLSDHFLGETGGSETVTLTASEVPVHDHTTFAQNGTGTSTNLSGNLPAIPSVNPRFPHQMYTTAAANVSMVDGSVASVGGGQPHNNMQPYLVLNFCIALQGVYPSRT